MGQVSKGVANALNQCSPDQGGGRSASLPWHHAGQLLLGESGRGQPVEGAIAGDDPWVETLVPGGECQN